MFEVADPQEIAEARRRRAQFDLNSAWLQSHSPDVCTEENRGKIVCIAGQEAFSAKTCMRPLPVQRRSILTMTVGLRGVYREKR
jgi:hypothetical protein